MYSKPPIDTVPAPTIPAAASAWREYEWPVESNARPAAWVSSTIPTLLRSALSGLGTSTATLATTFGAPVSPRSTSSDVPSGVSAAALMVTSAVVRPWAGTVNGPPPTVTWPATGCSDVVSGASVVFWIVSVAVVEAPGSSWKLCADSEAIAGCSPSRNDGGTAPSPQVVAVSLSV